MKTKDLKSQLQKMGYTVLTSKTGWTIQARGQRKRYYSNRGELIEALPDLPRLVKPAPPRPVVLGEGDVVEAMKPPMSKREAKGKRLSQQ